MTAPGADREEMVGLLERFNDTGGTFLPTALGTLLFAVALGVLGIALLRARVQPRWPATLIVVSRAIVVAAFIGGYASGEYLMAIVAGADLLLLVAFGAIALRVGDETHTVRA
jgi:hypothetical protein